MKQANMWVLSSVVIFVAVVGIMGDELTLSDVMEKMTQMERNIQNLETSAKMAQRESKIQNLETSAKMIQMERKIQNLEQQIEVQDSTSFFSVQIAQDTEVLNDDTLQFDLVKVNYGDDYIASGGIYIAPEDGYYMFTLVIRENGNSHCAGTVMRTLASDPGNPFQLCRAEAADYGHNTGTCTVVTELLAGDQLSVIADGRHADVENSFFTGDGYTSLTGILIRSGLE